MNNIERQRTDGVAKEDIDFAMGGQAVLEGVMMRGPKSYAVAVRRPQGDIVMQSKAFVPVVKRHKWLGLPIVRGAVSLIEMMFLGYRTLEYSANIAEQGFREMEEEARVGKAASGSPESEAVGPVAGLPAKAAVVAGAGGLATEMPLGEEVASGKAASKSPDVESAIGKWQMLGIFAVSMVFAMTLFVALPNIATTWVGKLLPYEVIASGDTSAGVQNHERATDVSSGLVEVNSPLLYNLVSGFFRVLIIVGYIWLISLMKDVRRLFQYHGAEHKVVMAHEKKLPLDVEHIRPVTTLHPRCGTTFIAIVILVSIVFFGALTAGILMVWPEFRSWNFFLRKALIILSHIVLMPLVGGVAYEVTRRAGRKPDFWLYRILLAPGYAFQKITTREPDDSMIEVALEAFNEALDPKQMDGACSEPAEVFA